MHDDYTLVSWIGGTAGIGAREKDAHRSTACSLAGERCPTKAAAGIRPAGAQLVTSVTCSPPASAGRPWIGSASQLDARTWPAGCCCSVYSCATIPYLPPAYIQLLHMPSMDGCGNVVDRCIGGANSRNLDGDLAT